MRARVLAVVAMTVALGACATDQVSRDVEQWWDDIGLRNRADACYWHDFFSDDPQAQINQMVEWLPNDIDTDEHVEALMDIIGEECQND